MTVADGGYFKLWRKLWDWPVWRAMTWDQRGVLITLLKDANWRDEVVMDRASLKFVTVSRGSILVSERELAALSGVGRRVVRTALRMLGSDPGDGTFLTQQPTQCGTLITICNYCKYQDVPTAADPASDPSPTQARPKPDPVSIYEAVEAVEEGISARAKKPAKKKTKASRPGTALLQAYYDCYQARHSVAPVVAWSGKDLSVADALLKGPPERTVDALSEKLEAYVRSTDPFVVRARWPFSLFPSQLHKLQAAPEQTRFGDDDFYELAAKAKEPK